MPINLKTQKYQTMGVTSMSELPFLVVTSGAGNENRIKYKMKKTTTKTYNDKCQ